MSWKTITEQRGYRRAVAVGVTTLIAGGGLLATQGAAQAAVSCGSQSVTNADDGYIILGEDANLQKAPYAACGTYARAKAGTKIWTWCMAENDYDNTWIWGRIADTQTYGWVYIGNASEVVSQPTRDEGFCPGEGPDPDAIDGADRIVEVVPPPDADDALPVQELDPSVDVDATLPPLPGAMDTDDDMTIPAPEGEDDGSDDGTVQAAAAAKLVYGAPIKRAKVIARAKYWVQKKVPYSSAAKAWDVNHGKMYRTDCQGMVDMAWALKTVPNTSGILPFVYRINWSNLKPGDELLRLGSHAHAMLFEKWANRAHTSIIAMEEPHTGDHAKEIKLKVSYFKANSFKPYRYKKIRD